MFDPADIVEALAQDPTMLAREQVREAIGSAEDLRGWIAGREARFIRALDAQPADPADPAKDTAGQLERDQNLDHGPAKRRADTAKELNELPGTQAALEGGEISEAHAEVLAKARSKADAKAKAALGAKESELLAAGAGETPRQFRERVERFVKANSDDDGRDEHERKKAAQRLSRHVDGDGMGQLRASLAPEERQTVWSSLDRVSEELFRRGHQDHPADAPVPFAERTSEQRLAEALVEICRRADQFDGPARSADQAVVILQYEDLLDRLARNGISPTQADGTPIPASVARRMACDAGIIPLILGGDSIPLDLGRARRTASRGQRLTLEAIWESCSFADCRAPFAWTEIHHIEPVNENDAFGKTDLANLTPVCRPCHDLAHKPGWRLVKHGDGTVVTTAPDGTTWHRQPNRRRSAEPPPAAAPEPEPTQAPAATLFTDAA
jgi:hypothetical protein